MSRAWLLPFLGLGLTACSANVATTAEAADAEASAVTAVVVVERTVGYAGIDSARSEAVARFVRVRAGAVDDDALRMVGAAVDFPPAGTCARVTPHAGAARPVELVDVGAIALETDATKKNLLVRRVPDVADLVSGVVYTARAADGEAPFPSRGRFVVRGAGASASNGDLDVAPFAVEAIVQGEPSDLHVGGVDAPAGASVAVSSSGTVDVSWEAAAASDDLVYVDVSGVDASGRAATVRCLFGDTGHAAIGQGAFPSDDGTIAVHRVHRESFRSRGIDAGEARFDFARVVSYRRR